MIFNYALYGALRVINTGLPFSDYKDSITYYALDGLYTPRCKKSGVQYGFGTAPLTRYIDNDSIFVSIEDKKLKIVDTNDRGNFTLEGSILGNDVEQVRKTISFLQYQKNIYNSPSNKIKRLKRMIDEIIVALMVDDIICITKFLYYFNCSFIVR